MRKLFAVLFAASLFCSPAFAQEYFKMKDGERVPMTQEEIGQRKNDDAIAAIPPVLPLNEQMEKAFLQMLPAHLGKPYLTKKVIKEIMQAKVAIIDANRLGLFDLSKAIIQDLTLPQEMEADRQVLLQLFP